MPLRDRDVALIIVSAVPMIGLFAAVIASASILRRRRGMQVVTTLLAIVSTGVYLALGLGLEPSAPIVTAFRH